MSIDNARIGYEGIKALTSALWKTENEFLKELKLSDLPLQWMKELGEAGKAKKIKISCRFPSLVTITCRYIVEYLEGRHV